MWGNGERQILVIVVMTVAACEVCIGLGMIVATDRRHLLIDVDELRELEGTKRHDFSVARPGVPAGGHAGHGVRLPGDVIAAASHGGLPRHGRLVPGRRDSLRLEEHVPADRHLVSAVSYATTVGIDAGMSTSWTRCRCS